MPDITMCLGNDCPIKETCYRFTAIPTPHWQSYSDFKYDEKLNVCEFFYHNGVGFKETAQKRIKMKKLKRKK